MFVYELSGCGFESSCSHINFRLCSCFEQGVPWNSGNYRVWIHLETRTWHDKNIQSKAFKLIKLELLKHRHYLNVPRTFFLLFSLLSSSFHPTFPPYPGCIESGKGCALLTLQRYPIAASGHWNVTPVPGIK